MVVKTPCFSGAAQTSRCHPEPARIAADAMPRNRPCSTTPGIAWSAPDRALGSGMRPKDASMIKCPPSVTKGAPSRIRSISGPARPRPAAARPIASSVALRPKRLTSIGSGKRPSVATSFERSAMTIMRCEAAATIFSRSSAPPPPLISDRSASTSSAPSMVRSSSGVSSSDDSGTPSFRQSAAVRSEVGTPITFSPPSTRSASSRTNASAVEPVPMPSRMPLPTWPSAARAASTLRAAASIAGDEAASVSFGAAPTIFAGAGKGFRGLLEMTGHACRMRPRRAKRRPSIATIRTRMRPPIIVFDLDGTLIDTAPDLIDSLNHALAANGFDAVDRGLVGRHVGMGGRAMIERVFALNQRRVDPAAGRAPSRGLRRALYRRHSRQLAPLPRRARGDRARRARPATSSRSAPTSRKPWRVSLIERLGPVRPVRRDLRRRHVRFPQARPAPSDRNDRAGRRRSVAGADGRRFAHRHRHRQGGRHPGRGRRFRLYRPPCPRVRAEHR